MGSITLLCTDGSELAVRALAAGLGVLAPAERTVLATVVEGVDASLVSGVSGFGTGVMSPQQYDEALAAQRYGAEQILRETAAALDLVGAEAIVLEGDAGHALCEYAAELPASVIVAGSRGRGGLKRAVLGSVSDHLVRHAPCPIVITGHE